MTTQTRFRLGYLALGIAFATAMPFYATAEEPHPLVLEVYDAFQSGQLDRWDAVLHDEIVINSSAGFGNAGIDAAKS